MAQNQPGTDACEDRDGRRSRDWKLVHFLDHPDGQLFDLQNDPDEVQNLWTDPNHIDKRRELLDELREWRIRSGVQTSEWAAEWR